MNIQFVFSLLFSPKKVLFSTGGVKLDNLSTTEVVQINIAPKEHVKLQFCLSAYKSSSLYDFSALFQVSYTKTTQTDVSPTGFREFQTGSNEWFEDSPLGGAGSQNGTPGESSGTVNPRI